MHEVTNRGDGHQGSGEGEDGEPVEYPAHNIRNTGESLTVKLCAKVSEHEDSCGGNAASQDVDNYQQSKARGCIVCKKTKHIRERCPKRTKKYEDEEKSAPCSTSEECLVVIKPKD